MERKEANRYGTETREDAGDGYRMKSGSGDGAEPVRGDVVRTGPSDGSDAALESEFLAVETFGDSLERERDRTFTGRSFELSTFRTLLERKAATPASIVNVYGTGGIGKTALLLQAKRLATEAGAAFALVDARETMSSPALLAQELIRQLRTYERQEPPGPSATAGGHSASGAAAADLGYTVDANVGGNVEAGADAAADGDGALEPEADDARAADALARTVRRLAARGRRVALALDTYDEAGRLDEWLRAKLLPLLPTDTLVVLAGRKPLRGAWSLSPELRRMTIALPLGGLEYAELRAYLRGAGIEDETWADLLWLETSGHPLTLSLLAPIAASRSAAGHAPSLPLSGKRETLEELLELWLAEAADEALRRVLYAASVPRSFDLGLLNAIGEQPCPEPLFDQLLRLSFVRRTFRGWQLHDLVRDALQLAYRARLPESFDAVRNRTVALLGDRIAARQERGEPVSWEAAELLSLVGNPILRAHFRHTRSTEHYWENVDDGALEEAEAYIRRRRERTKPYRIVCADPETGELFRYELTAEQSVARLRGWSARELHALGTGALKLLRGPSGEASGLAALVPIRRETLPFLARSPVSADYFRSQMPRWAAETASGGDAAGWFVFAVDADDLENKELRANLFHLAFDMALAGTVLVSAPPPFDYYRDSHAASGYVVVPGAESTLYGGASPIYELDTRGGMLRRFLDRVIEAGGAGAALFSSAASPATAPPSPADRPPRATAAGETGSPRPLPFTPREAEVAELLAAGATNGEIARALFISEAAVKKHINAMLYKTDTKNRTQLAAVVLASR